MIHKAGEAGHKESPVLHAAIGLTEQIRAASNEIEAGRRIPQSIAAAMKQAGIFGMAMPRVWGGPELDPLTQIRVIEALAMADGSVGWCAMIAATGAMSPPSSIRISPAPCTLTLSSPLAPPRRRLGRRTEWRVATGSMAASRS